MDQIRRRVWDRVASLKKGYSLPEYLLRMRGIKAHRNSSSWTAENLTVKLVAELEQMGVSTDWASVALCLLPLKIEELVGLVMCE